MGFSPVEKLETGFSATGVATVRTGTSRDSECLWDRAPCFTARMLSRCVGIGPSADVMRASRRTVQHGHADVVRQVVAQCRNRIHETRQRHFGVRRLPQAGQQMTDSDSADSGKAEAVGGGNRRKFAEDRLHVAQRQRSWR